jgi:hypothetical protein
LHAGTCHSQVPSSDIAQCDTYMLLKILLVFVSFFLFFFS